MTDVMTASANAIGHARAENRERVTSDDLLLGALEAAARLGVVSFGSLVLDLHEISSNGDRDLSGGEADPPAYAPDAAAVFDRAARIAREDGEARVRLVHLLAAFEPERSEFLGDLMSEHGFDQTAWRAALAEWDGAASASPTGGTGQKVLTVDEAADTLGVHAQTIRGYIKSGKLPAYRIGGERSIRIYVSDLYDLLEPVEPGSDGHDRGE